MESYAHNFPIRASDKLVFDNFLEYLSMQDLESFFETNQVILDVACGVAESSWHLREQNPKSLVIGVERSPHRLKKSGLFEKKSGLFTENESSHQKSPLLLLQMDITRFWILCEKEKLIFQKQMIFYPNPYPKPKLLKKRWYAHPLFSLICSLSDHIELRTNVFSYVRNFDRAYQKTTGKKSRLQAFSPKNPLTPFERKYSQRHSCLWQWNSI